MCLSVNSSIEKQYGHILGHIVHILLCIFAQQIAPHVASVNASIEQRGDQHF